MNLGTLLAGNMVYRSLNIATGFIITILLTRLMAAEGYGVFTLMIANASLFSLLSCLGSESGITYHFASGKMRPGKIFTIVYLIIILQLVLLAATEFIHVKLSGSYWILKGNEKSILLWGMVYVVAITLTDKYTAFFNGSHLYTLVNKILFYCSGVTLLFFGWLLVAGRGEGTIFYLQIFIISALLQAVVLVIFFHAGSARSLHFLKVQRDDWSIFFSYSMIVFITNAIQFLAYRVDYWLVDYYRGSEDLGFYSLAVKLGQMFWVVPVLFAGIIFPKSADRQSPFLLPAFLSVVRVINTFTIVAMIIAALLAGWAIPFLFKATFRESIRPFIYLLPGIFMFGINIMLAGYFAGKNRLRINLAGSALCFFLVLWLDLWLIPLHGIHGAAIASAIAYSAAAVFSIRRFAGMENQPVLSLLFMQKNDWKSVMDYFVKKSR